MGAMSRSWVKIHTGIGTSKVAEVPYPSRWLYVLLLCYCAEHLTDGVVDQHAQRVVLAEAGLRRRALLPLISTGLLEVVQEDGETRPDHAHAQARNAQVLRLTGYLEWNPSAQQVSEKRQLNAARMRKVRADVQPHVPDHVRDERSRRRPTNYYPPKDLTRGPSTATGKAGDSSQGMSEAAAAQRERHARRARDAACPVCDDTGVWLDADLAAHDCDCKWGQA